LKIESDPNLLKKTRSGDANQPEVIMQRQVLLVLALLAVGVFSLDVVVHGLAYADVNDLRHGHWSGATGVGFLGNTPDGAEFALNGHADYFFTPNVSVGPLAQYAGTGNDIIFGLSVQAKYWWGIPGGRTLTKLVVQGGIGFVRAGIKDNDSGAPADTYASFLIPVGVGLDYTVTKHVAVTADFLVNFTSLGETVHVGGRDVDLHTNVMPGLYLGMRF
jgi:hypothetical protein